MGKIPIGEHKGEIVVELLPQTETHLIGGRGEGVLIVGADNGNNKEMTILDGSVIFQKNGEIKFFTGTKVLNVKKDDIFAIALVRPVEMEDSCLGEDIFTEPNKRRDIIYYGHSFPDSEVE